MKRTPLISIIIANYNYGHFLEESIRSVWAQSFQDFELIIIDGGSTDNSVEVIQKYALGLPAGVRRDDPSAVYLNLPSTPISYWISEEDKGQSDAFNKGFAHATGRFLTWLNADDMLIAGSLARLAREVDRYPNCEWFTGNVVQFESQEKVITRAPWGPHSIPTWMQGYGYPLQIFGPTTFWKRELLKRVGNMNIDMHYAMDTEYWARMALAGIKMRRINCDCWAFRMHAESKTAGFSMKEVLNDKIKHRQMAAKKESEYIQYKIGYESTLIGRLIILIWRVLDGSIVVGVFRKFTMVGKRIEDVYETK